MILQLNDINSTGSLTSSGGTEADILTASSNDVFTIDVLLREMLKRDGGLIWGSSESGMEDFNKTGGRVSAGGFDDYMICADAVLQKIQVGVILIMYPALDVKSIHTFCMVEFQYVHDLRTSFVKKTYEREGLERAILSKITAEVRRSI